MDWLILILIAAVLIMVTSTTSCAVKNDTYTVKGHEENSILLSNVSNNIEKFHNTVENFYAEKGLADLLGGTPESPELTKAKEARDLANLKKETAEAEAAAARALEAAQVSATTGENFRNFY